jgi:predicted negative regulator of RcsB-dependent stress response
MINSISPRRNAMKKGLLLSLVIITLLCVAGWTSYGQKSTQPQVAYEYQVLSDPTETGSMEEGRNKLNELGAQGWQLVSINYERGVTAPAKLYFMRAKR